MSTDSVNTYQGEGTSPAGTPDHIHEMVAKIEAPVETSDGGFSDEAPAKILEDRPEWLPEKFGSAQEMAQAYKSLEQKLGNNKEDLQQPEQTEQETKELQEQSPSQVHHFLDDKGLDFNAFQQEFNERGDLSAEAYTALEEAGVGKEMVDTWIAGQSAKAEQNIQKIYGLTNGDQGYKQMLEWADNNLHSTEVEAFNKSIDNLDVTAELAVAGLYARYQQAEGSAPSLMTGDTNVSVQPRYDSLAQITSAMKDPRYAIDPAYRAQVAGRLGNSTVL
jgi:hypothetical protein